MASLDFTQPTESKCMAFMNPSGPATPHTITRRAMGPNDIVIDIKFAGVCHSDIHTVRDEWGKSEYPCVPGHEIAGPIVAVGANVKGFAVGEMGGVGCLVDSCRSCVSCSKGNEQYCGTGPVWTYNSKMKYCVETGASTYGGYSKHIVVDASFALKMPSNLDLAAATPLLCAGITVYSPMIHFGLRPDMKFGVAGLGGLGHVAIKIGHAFGCDTTVISRGTAKKETALNDLGADHYVDAKNVEEFAAAKNSLDFIISTISAPFDLAAYVGLLKPDGQFICVGVPPEELKFNMGTLITGRRVVAGSLIGGLRETQDMLDFCGRNNITCDIELITADRINEAHDRTVASDVKYRFVIDTSSIV